MNIEIELKLSIHAADAERVGEAPIVRTHLVGAARTVRLVNTYHDTPDHALRERGYGLRLRCLDGTDFVQTLKRGGGGGLSRREEWECAVAGDALDLDRFEDAEPHDLFANAALREALAPIFVTEFTRTIRNLRFEDDTAIELAVDIGVIRTAAARRPINEVELELMAGTQRRVFETARALHDTVPLRILTRSKARRGYELKRRAHLPPAAPAPPLPEGADWRSSLRHRVDHLLANEPAVEANPEPTAAVTEMQQAAGALRSCIERHRSDIPAGDHTVLENGVQWLVQALESYRPRAVVASPRFTAFLLDACWRSS